MDGDRPQWLGPWRLDRGRRVWVRPFRKWHPKEVCSVGGCWVHELEVVRF